MKARARGAQEAGRQRIWVMKNCIRLKSVAVFPKRLQSQPSRSGICIESEATPSGRYMLTTTNRDCATYHPRRPPIHGLGTVGSCPEGQSTHSKTSPRSRGGGGGGAAGGTASAKAGQKLAKLCQRSRGGHQRHLRWHGKVRSEAGSRGRHSMRASDRGLRGGRAPLTP